MTTVQLKIANARKFWNLWHIDKVTARFSAHNVRRWQSWKKNGPAEVLCNIDPVCLTHIKLSYLINILAQRNNAVIKTFSSRSAASQRRYRQIYWSFNAQGYIEVKAWAEDDWQVKEIVQDLWPKVISAQALYDLKIAGIWLGIDILETYLRKCERPTLELTDPRLKQLFVETVGLVLFWQDYLAKHPVRAIGMSIDGYTANNTITKVAQSFGIPVYAPDFIAPRIRDAPFAASVAFARYRELFAKLVPEEQNYGLTKAKTQLDRRLSGQVGVDMIYSTKSAWHKNFSKKQIIQKKNQRTKVLICSHDFVDAPHSHGGMLFVDFVEWLKFVASVAHETNYDWYIKLHADHDPASSEVIKDMAVSFPQLTVVPPSTSHHQLIHEGINVVLTCYGSVGHEYPLLGIPVVNAGYNPHISYSFNYHARSKTEYRDYLRRLPSLQASVNAQDVYEFYYMYHYDELAKTPVSWWQELAASLTSEIKAEPAVYDIWQRELTPSRHEELIGRMQQALVRRVHHAAELARL